MICWCYDDLTLIENALTGQTAARPLFTPCVKRVRNGSFYFKNLFSRHFAGALDAPSCVHAAWLGRGVEGLKCSGGAVGEPIAKGDNSSGRKTSFWRDSTADPVFLNLKRPEKVLWLSLLDKKGSRQTGKHLNTQTL